MNILSKSQSAGNQRRQLLYHFDTLLTNNYYNDDSPCPILCVSYYFYVLAAPSSYTYQPILVFGTLELCCMEILERPGFSIFKQFISRASLLQIYCLQQKKEIWINLFCWGWVWRLPLFSMVNTIWIIFTFTFAVGGWFMFQRGFIFRKSRFYATHRKHIQTVFGRGNDGHCCKSITKYQTLAW